MNMHALADGQLHNIKMVNVRLCQKYVYVLAEVVGPTFNIKTCIKLTYLT